MNRDDKAKWLHAMEEEIAKLESKGIFELIRISDISKDKRIFPGKWVYDSKIMSPQMTDLIKPDE